MVPLFLQLYHRFYSNNSVSAVWEWGILMRNIIFAGGYG